jgi:hypothetical protein
MRREGSCSILFRKAGIVRSGRSSSKSRSEGSSRRQTRPKSRCATHIAAADSAKPRVSGTTPHYHAQNKHVSPSHLAQFPKGRSKSAAPEDLHGSTHVSCVCLHFCQLDHFTQATYSNTQEISNYMKQPVRQMDMKYSQ